MAISGINQASAPIISQPAKPKPTVSSSATSTSAPAATAQISHQAQNVAAASVVTSASTGAPAPKVNTVKLANKESNEPLQVLTKQAKHGDVVAKLILKQINAKQAAKTASATPNTQASAAEESSETEEVPEKPGTVSSKPAEQSGEPASGGVAESGKGELVDQHA